MIGIFDGMPKWLKFGIWVFIIFGIIAFLGGFFAGMGDNSDGVREGKLIKFSERGIIYRTFDGELAMNSFTYDSAGSMSPYVFSFSACKNEINKKCLESVSFDEFQACQEQLNMITWLNDNVGENVKITYHSPIFYWHWNQGTKYCVEKIEVIEG